MMVFMDTLNHHDRTILSLFWQLDDKLVEIQKELAELGEQQEELEWSENGEEEGVDLEVTAEKLKDEYCVLLYQRWNHSTANAHHQVGDCIYSPENFIRPEHHIYSRWFFVTAKLHLFVDSFKS